MLNVCYVGLIEIIINYNSLNEELFFLRKIHELEISRMIFELEICSNRDYMSFFAFYILFL